MKVSELMVKHVITCPDTAFLGEAAKLMWEHDIGFLPVISSATGALFGVVTDRDGFFAAWFQGKPVAEIPVRTAMSTRIATCPPDADAEPAERLMREFQVHRLPVVTREGKLVGIVSLSDFARQAVRDGNEEQEEKVAATLGAISQPRTPHIRPGAGEGTSQGH
jgi:CBS domain-containing protein